MSSNYLVSTHTLVLYKNISFKESEVWQKIISNKIILILINLIKINFTQKLPQHEDCVLLDCVRFTF